MSLHINEFVASIGNPAKTYLWSIAIPSIAISDLRGQTAQFPGVGSSDIELWYQGQKANFAGGPEYEHTWQVVMAESEKGDIGAAIKAWRQKCWNQTDGSQVVPAEYKEDITIKALRATDGVAWLTCTLHGAYPKTVDAVDLDRSANTEAWKWSVTFNYDYWD